MLMTASGYSTEEVPGMDDKIQDAIQQSVCEPEAGTVLRATCLESASVSEGTGRRTDCNASVFGQQLTPQLQLDPLKKEDVYLSKCDVMGRETPDKLAISFLVPSSSGDEFCNLQRPQLGCFLSEEKYQNDQSVDGNREVWCVEMRKKPQCSFEYLMELQDKKTALQDLLNHCLQQELEVRASIYGDVQETGAAGPGWLSTFRAYPGLLHGPCSDNVHRVPTPPVAPPELPPSVPSLQAVLPPQFSPGEVPDVVAPLKAPPGLEAPPGLQPLMPPLVPPGRPSPGDAMREPALQTAQAVQLPAVTAADESIWKELSPSHITCLPVLQSAPPMLLPAVSQQVPQEVAQTEQQKHLEPQPQPQLQKHNMAYVDVPNGHHEICLSTQQLLASVRVPKVKKPQMKLMETVLYVARDVRGHGVNAKQEDALKMWLTVKNKSKILGCDAVVLHLNGDVFNRLGGCTKYMVWMFVGEKKPCGVGADSISGPGWHAYGVNDFQERNVCWIRDISLTHLDPSKCFYLGFRLMPME